MTDVEIPTDTELASVRALARWLPCLSDSTKTGYSRDVTAWINWCHLHGVDWLHPTGRDLGEYLDSIRKMALASRARRWSAINSWYRWLREEGETTANPEIPASARPRPKGLHSSRLRGITAVDAQELQAAAEADSPRSGALVALLLTAGLRIQEALNIRIRDLVPGPDGQAMLTVIGKGEKTRTVVVPPYTVQACRQISQGRPPRDFLFVTSTGAQWQQSHVRKIMRRLGLTAGVAGLHPHTLRHTAASQALDAGHNIVAVKEFLGHAFLSTTEPYVQAAATIRDTPAYDLQRLVKPEETP